MENKTYNECVSDLEDHFGKKLKSPKFYYTELKHIPDQAFREIVRGRIRAKAPNPGQFPTIQELLDDWRQWLENHPDKKARVEYVFCPHCESHMPGQIRVRIPSQSQEYIRMGITHRESLVLCGHCPNATMETRNPTWPRLRVDEIESRGWEVLTQYRTREDDDPAPKEWMAEWKRHTERALGFKLDFSPPPKRGEGPTSQK